MSIYEKHTFKDVRLPFIINKVSLTSIEPQDEWGNFHDNIEMIFVKKGDMNMRLDGVNVHATEGATIIINQNALHAIGSHSTVEYYYVIIDNSFCVENHLHIEELYFKTLVYDPEIFDKLDTLAECYYNGDNDKFFVQKVRSAVLALLVLICERYSHERRGSEGMPTLKFVKKAIEHIFSEFQKDISLEDIAGCVGVSKYHFAREFHKATGYTFVDFLNGVRCEHAKQLLKTTKKDIYEICHECGFSSSSYFSRIFKEYSGVTPLKYRHGVSNKNKKEHP